MNRTAILAFALCMAVAAAHAETPADDPRITPIVLAYRNARPAVVNISSQQVVTARLGGFGGDLFDDIFPSPFTRKVPVQSLGSGFVIHPRGFVVTNAHVVRRAQKITVTTSDGQSYEARVLSADPQRDLAVLKIDPPEGATLPFLRLGRSDDLMVGETVIAIGNPLGYANSLTTGVVSAVDRKLDFRDGLSFDGLIQIDAPINPGNSGGPLLNIKGELIGINTAIRADAQNIGFAIPTDHLADDLPRLLDAERINRVVFGAAVRRDGSEVRVASVRPGTPAEGKLIDGDRIAAVNGEAVTQMSDFVCPMLTIKPGQPLRLSVVRGDETIDVEVMPVEKPKPDGKALARALFGVTLKPITPELAADLRLPVERGLLVVGVDVGSPAEKLGVGLKDVVFQIDRFYVSDLDSLGQILEDVAPGSTIQIGVVHGRSAVWTQIRIADAADATSAPSEEI